MDPAAGLVTVEAGCPLRVLNDDAARAAAWRWPNMGDIQVQTVAGAIQTGTHGTGRDLGGMAAQVAGLELVLADGELVSAAPPSEDRRSLFEAARVGLGALGVLTAVTFRVVPAFLLTAREEPMRWAEVHRPAGRADQRERALRVLLVPAHRGLPDQAEQPRGGPGPAAAAAGGTCWTTSSCPTRCSALTCRLGQRYPAHDPGGQRRRQPGRWARGSYTDAAVPGVHQPAPGPVQGAGVRGPAGARWPTVLAEVRALFARRDWRISFPIEVRVAPRR